MIDLNLNHGAYGSPPRPVIQAMRDLQDKIESNVNVYLKRTYFEPLKEVRSTLAGMIGAREDELMMVPNTSHGINNIVKHMKWEQGDVVVICRSSPCRRKSDIADSTTYGAIAQTMKFVCDRFGVDLEVIDVEFPCSHAEVLRKTHEVIERYNVEAVSSYTWEAKAAGKHPEKRIRVVVVDTISSNPA